MVDNAGMLKYYYAQYYRGHYMAVYNALLTNAHDQWETLSYDTFAKEATNATDAAMAELNKKFGMETLLNPIAVQQNGGVDFAKNVLAELCGDTRNG